MGTDEPRGRRAQREQASARGRALNDADSLFSTGKGGEKGGEVVGEVQLVCAVGEAEGDLGRQRIALPPPLPEGARGVDLSI